MVKITKTWQTVFFTATKGEVKEKVELNMNNENKSYTLCTENQEMVKFDNKSKTELKLLMDALKTAHKYINENLFGDEKRDCII